MLALFASMFALGLVTSVHCISMCGPMVVTYAVKSEEGGPWHRKVLPNLVYQAAKLVSYVLVGLALGAIGAAFKLDGIRPYVTAAAGVFMLILGLGMTGKVPWAARLTPRPPRFLITALSKLRRKAKSDADTGESTLITPIAFGLLTGLMPCAPLQAAELAAAGTGSVTLGGVAMLAFGLGTAPLMLIFGTLSSLIPREWKHRLSMVLAVVVMFFGLIFLNRAAMLLGSPVTFNSIRMTVTGASKAPSGPANFTTDADGVAKVNLTIRNATYEPYSLQIPADRPVRLVVDRQEDNACSAQLKFPQLGSTVYDLKANGTTTIELPAAKSGTYTMTCGMGMLSGQLVVGDGAAASDRPSSAPWLIAAALAAGAAVWSMRRKPAPAPVATMPARGAESTAPTPKTGSAQSRSAIPAPKAATILGFSPLEFVLVATIIVLAIFAGLAAGGFLNN